MEEIRDRLYARLKNFSVEQLDTAMNLYIWLGYHGFTVENLRTNFPYIIYMKMLVERRNWPKSVKSWPVFSKEVSKLGPGTLTKQDALSMIGYMGLRSWRKIGKWLEKWNLSTKEVDIFVRESRKAAYMELESGPVPQ